MTRTELLNQIEDDFKTNLRPQLDRLAEDARAEIALLDAIYHDQHGSNTRWAEWEWAGYHELIAKALSQFLPQT